MRVFIMDAPDVDPAEGDGEVGPVAVELTEKDRENIAAMAPDATLYCVFPAGWNTEKIETWLAVLKRRTGTIVE